MIILTLSIIEITMSVLYFHRESAYPLAVFHYWHRAKKKIQRRRLLNLRSREIGIWQKDKKFGFSHIPNSTGTHETESFKVVYNIGNDGERLIPTPKKVVGRLLFVGGSDTFGHGVNDSENYPYILGTEYWKDWKIVNKAVTAWGTSHAYMAVCDAIESDTPPAVIIYGMSSVHVQRNYVRRSWVEKLVDNNRGHPHFEIINGSPIFQGVVGIADSKADGREVRKEELELTNLLLRSMKQKCIENEIPFIVILLPEKGGSWPPTVLKTLYQSKIKHLDLSEITLEAFPYDAHPNSDDHRQIAGAIAKSFVSKILELAKEN